MSSSPSKWHATDLSLFLRCYTPDDDTECVALHSSRLHPSILCMSQLLSSLYLLPSLYITVKVRVINLLENHCLPILLYAMESLIINNYQLNPWSRSRLQADIKLKQYWTRIHWVGSGTLESGWSAWTLHCRIKTVQASEFRPAQIKPRMHFTNISVFVLPRDHGLEK